MLDLHIVGQEKLKKTLSVALFNHYTRVDMNDLEQGNQKMLILGSSHVFIDKSNVLLMGPTGCGKTLIAKTVADILEVPFSSNDATSLTQAGYVGEDVETCILNLLRACDYDIVRAQRGVIFIDEIEYKINSPKQSS